MSAIRIYFTNRKILTSDTEKAVFSRADGTCFTLGKEQDQQDISYAEVISGGGKLINWERVCFVTMPDMEQRELYEE